MVPFPCVPSRRNTTPFFVTEKNLSSILEIIRYLREMINFLRLLYAEQRAPRLNLSIRQITLKEE